ncbi:MAG: hypothetical protein HXN23_08195 [Porphyromonas sp.]|jgi:hypothetical protein|uniref:hypothetical protein n=1 Tax=Porphyromonas sp. TaxID=1924944 RepID=UPI001CAE44B5|nr:hypothetical protein [Porphyromonas sp.]MBF1406204.1 hypothetical protein [Porphyromonas sp.]
MKSGAKDLFFSFLGSKYQMMREGVIELYVSYNVSEKDEVIWIEELFQSLYSRLQYNLNDLNALHQLICLIECHCLVEGVPKLYDLLWGNVKSITHPQELAVSIGRIINFLKDLPKGRKSKEYIKMFEDLIQNLPPRNL